MSPSPYKVGDVVLVKSLAGEAIPKFHVRLLERYIKKPSHGWDGYEGWEAELINQAEADLLRKKWSIPFKSAGDKTWIYDSEILKKVETT
jgi:hypothetical protein